MRRFWRRWGTRRGARMCPPYVAGLIGPGDRKSVQPMAARDRRRELRPACTTSSRPASGTPRRWRRSCSREADRLVGGDDAWLIVDDTALPKKGARSVGVAPQYASALGKNANCQTLVSLTLASGEVPVHGGPAAVPARELDERPRAPGARRRARRHRQAYRTKPEIALAEIDRLRAAGVRFGCVLADAGYGLSAPFRQALSERGLTWAVGIPRQPEGLSGRRGDDLPRRGPRPPAQAARPRRNVGRRRRRCWTAARGERSPGGAAPRGGSSARFAAVRVRVADGPPQRIGDMGAQHLPGEEVWLVGERRSTGERKYYLSNLPADTPLKPLAGAIKARWVCEQAHQQLKEELGLDHFEGRSWTGLHRHALMTMIAFAFLQSRRLSQARREKKKSPARRLSRAFQPYRPGHHRRARHSRRPRDARIAATHPLHLN